MMTSVDLSLKSPEPLTLSELQPGLTDRATFVGQTGSGKSFLARYLLAQRPFVVVHDGKNAPELLAWTEYTIVTRLRDATRLKAQEHPRILYRPDEHEVADLDVQNAFFRWLFRRGNTTVYVDETFMLKIGVYPYYHFICITQGRSRGVEVWSGMQRPSWIPLVTISESEHFFAFRLQYDEDRLRVQGVTGLDANELTPESLPKHYFWYIQTGEAPRGPLTLHPE